MGYFNRLPDTYIAEGTSTDEDYKYRLVKNIFRRAVTIPNLSQYITCLLYTSPSPRDQGESRMPSSA